MTFSGSRSLILLGLSIALLLSGAGCSESTTRSGHVSVQSKVRIPTASAAELLLPISEIPNFVALPTGATQELSTLTREKFAELTQGQSVQPGICRHVLAGGTRNRFDKTALRAVGGGLSWVLLVTKGSDDSFTAMKKKVSVCPIIKVISKIGDIDLNLTYREVADTQLTTYAIYGEGRATTKTGEQLTFIQAYASYVRGCTLTLSVTKFGASVTAQEEAELVSLLNQQIIRIQSAF